MQNTKVEAITSIFQSRLKTLEHIIQTGLTHFEGSESFLQKRIVDDMLPFGTQIAFTCNQPRNFALWCKDQPMDNLNPEVTSIDQAHEHITNTKALIADIDIDDAKLEETTRINLTKEMAIEVTGNEYVNEFLMPNFYFHLVTAYDILRMAGVPLGKRDYMIHMGPFIRVT